MMWAAAVLVVSYGTRAAGQSAATEQAPGAEEQQKLIAAVREYADRYVSNLPNFLCIQVTEQYQTGRKADHWLRGDTLTSKLVFSNGREQRSLELVNNKAAKDGRRRHSPLETEGEFGVLLDRIFSERSHASFTWNRWDVVRGKRVAVFDYAIDREHSTLKLMRSDLAQAIIAYDGLLYADAETGAVWRVTMTLKDIPAELETDSSSTTIDYEEATIGGVRYLLPLAATVEMSASKHLIRNEIRFENYQKFDTDSTITYSTAAPQ